MRQHKLMRMTPNLSYTDREVRIISGAALLLALLYTAPEPFGWWSITALIAIPIVASGIIAWDPLYSVFGINRYNSAEGEIQQRSWSCPNIGTVDRIARLVMGAILLTPALTTDQIAWQSIILLLAIPVIMTAIMAWDPIYALVQSNTFASKSDVRSADPELEEKTLAKYYRFPKNPPSLSEKPRERAA